MGGKRKKSSNGPIKKESKYKIPVRFDCPLCDAKASIIVKIFRSTGDATVRCRVCGAGDGTRWKVLRLEKPVDVFFRFHEALLRKDQADLQNIELVREEQQHELGLPSGAAADGSAADRHPSATGETWNAKAIQMSPTPNMTATQPLRMMGSLGDLQRKLALSMNQKTRPDIPRRSGPHGNVDGDEYEAEAEGNAAHHFAPRQEIYADENDEDDEYNKLFQ